MKYLFIFLMMLPNLVIAQEFKSIGNWTYSVQPYQNLCLLDGEGDGFSVTFAFEQTDNQGLGGFGVSFESQKIIWERFSIETTPSNKIIFDIVDDVYNNGLLTLRGDFSSPKDISVLDMMYSSDVVTVRVYDRGLTVSGDLDTSMFSQALKATNKCLVQLDAAS